MRATESPRSPRGRAVGLALLAFALATSASAQRLYKYHDSEGRPVFADRPPAGGGPYESAELERTFEAPELILSRREIEGGAVVLVAKNTYYCPLEIAFQLSSMDNLSRDTPWGGSRVLPARSSVDLVTLEPGDPSRPLHFVYHFQYIPGDPNAEHRPPRPYRLPWALARSFPVSQAAPDQVTHTDAASAYAVDFAMPVGTPVHAARGGVVIDVAADFFGAGLDPEIDGPRANIVRILHDDGSMALYAHLAWNTIRVRPGQRVERGEYLADSGNTGFSTGPHLHFVVQINDHGKIVSVPIEFEGAGGRALDLHTGDEPTAY